jgi:hypothetical protein
MPLPSTMTPIVTNTLTANATTVTFSSIPQTYTDLCLIVTATSSSGGDNLWIRYNGSASGYSGTTLYGTGTAAGTTRRSTQTRLMTEVAYPTTAQGFHYIANIMNYSNTTTYKTTLIRANAAGQGAEVYVGLYQSTAGITQLDFQVGVGTVSFATGSTFTLYGIKAA